jgi:hypothetical protein
MTGHVTLLRVAEKENCNLCAKQCGMIEKLTPIDAGILLAAAIMALGAFCPIVHMPIVGSITYVMGGRGDGILVVLSAMVIVVLVITGYRRTTGIVAVVALAIMLRALIGFSSALGEANAGLARSLQGNPFGGIAKTLVSSVGLGWGWVLLIGGALAVVILAIIAHTQQQLPTAIKAKTDQDGSDANFLASADQRIAEYIENRKISPSQRAASQQTGFGKRQRT